MKPRLRWRRDGDRWIIRVASEPWSPYGTMAWSGHRRYFDDDAELFEAFFAPPQEFSSKPIARRA